MLRPCTESCSRQWVWELVAIFLMVRYIKNCHTFIFRCFIKGNYILLNSTCLTIFKLVKDSAFGRHKIDLRFLLLLSLGLSHMPRGWTSNNVLFFFFWKKNNYYFEQYLSNSIPPQSAKMGKIKYNNNIILKEQRNPKFLLIKIN